MKFSWCWFDESIRNADGQVAPKGKGGAKNGFRKRFWFCKVCSDFDCEVKKLPKSTGLGICCLREFEQKKLLEHEQSSKHVESKQGLEAFRNSTVNALTSSISRDRKQKFFCIYIAAYVAKNQLPLDTYTSMIEFSGNVLEVDLPREAGKLKWSSRGIGTGFIHAISSRLYDIQIEDIRRSPWV
jgi:hypothetical protein